MAALLAWSPDETTLRQWAGPSVRYPATPASFWEDINTPDATSFVLESPEHGVVAFGQIRHREQTFGHLARLVVSPGHRGSGFGHALCRALMAEAPRLHAISAFSLYVYEDNHRAHELYRSIGFVDSGRHPDYPTMILMLAPVD